MPFNYSTAISIPYALTGLVFFLAIKNSGVLASGVLNLFLVVELCSNLFCEVFFLLFEAFTYFESDNLCK